MEYRPGLEGVPAAETALSLIDGEAGRLFYRGTPAGEWAVTGSFEETANYLWRGAMPCAEQLDELKRKFAQYRKLPPNLKNVLDTLPENMTMMDVLRTAVSSLGINETWPPTVDQATRITAVVPTIIAYRYRQQKQERPILPDENLGHTANYLYMLTGTIPKDAHVEALDAYLILTMEHGLNASTFTARVITSTQSDLYSAVSGAIGAMKGPLHGGAPSGVARMLDAIGTKENAERWLRSALEKDERLMGFGHRVYKTEDPRASALRKVTSKLAADDPWFDLALETERIAIRLLEEYKPGRRLYTNVEFYAAAVLRAIALPEPLFTSTFSASRAVGWTAHALEQAENNRIFRPKAHYIGRAN
ncbi:MAG TPA: citrate synthase/methylcitrate synthase [Bacillales bacterium]|nr:citrate synthase/methylcitrate synthase [Bacillales bacterium]